VNVMDDKCRSALHYACKSKDINVLNKLLYQKSMKVTYKPNHSGNTVLHEFCKHFDDVDTLNFLLNFISYRVKNKNKEKPRNIAKKNNNLNIVKELKNRANKRKIKNKKVE